MSKGEGEAQASVLDGPAPRSTGLGEGGATSAASRRGGGVGIDPSERVVVATLPPSLGRFLDLWEGLAVPLDFSALSAFGGSTSRLRRPLRSATFCLCLSRTLTAVGRS